MSFIFKILNTEKEDILSYVVVMMMML